MERLEQELETRGYSVTVLFDADATSKNVEKKLNDLNKPLFIFCGHGTLNYSNLSCLCLQDRDVGNHEISPNVFGMILDCCHSGADNMNSAATPASINTFEVHHGLVNPLPPVPINDLRRGIRGVIRQAAQNNRADVLLRDTIEHGFILAAIPPHLTTSERYRTLNGVPACRGDFSVRALHALMNNINPIRVDRLLEAITYLTATEPNVEDQWHQVRVPILVQSRFAYNV